MNKPLVSEQALVEQRKEGLEIVSPFKARLAKLVITRPSEYEQADRLLSEIRRARAEWKAKNLQATEKLREAMEAQKQAMAAYKDVFDTIDGPLAGYESSVKQLMKDYKLEEARQLQAAEEARLAEQRRIEAEIAAKEQAEAKAKTAAMTKRILDARAALQQQLASAKAQPAAKAVKTAGSTARRVKKYRISDLIQFYQWVLADYEERGSLISVDNVQLGALFSLDKPKVGPWMPGVEVYEDINIAGR